jgi:hypothetical protein
VSVERKQVRGHSRFENLNSRVDTQTFASYIFHFLLYFFDTKSTHTERKKTLLLEKPSATKIKNKKKINQASSCSQRLFSRRLSGEKPQLTSSSSSSKTLLPSRKYCRTNANARQEILETHPKKKESFTTIKQNSNPFQKM